MIRGRGGLAPKVSFSVELAHAAAMSHLHLSPGECTCQGTNTEFHTGGGGNFYFINGIFTNIPLNGNKLSSSKLGDNVTLSPEPGIKFLQIALSPWPRCSQGTLMAPSSQQCKQQERATHFYTCCCFVFCLWKLSMARMKGFMRI